MMATKSTTRNSNINNMLEKSIKIRFSLIKDHNKIYMSTNIWITARLLKLEMTTHITHIIRITRTIRITLIIPIKILIQ